MARRLGVSRQIIVQDIAVLRASGQPVISTPRGYMLWQAPEQKRYQSVIVSRHTKGQCEDELRLLVDLGVKIIDVVIEHPIYGEIRRPLMIQSRQDVSEFIEKINHTGAELLCELTGGVHLHTIEAPREDLLEKARQALKLRGYLVE